MANEILKRNPTSSGNKRVFTWSGWIKINRPNTTQNCIWYVASSGSNEFSVNFDNAGWFNIYDYSSGAYQYQYVTNRRFRDYSNWFHLCISIDTTQFREDDRFKIYINGVLYNGTYYSTSENSGINYETRMNTPSNVNYIGQNIFGGTNYSAMCQLTDLYLVDGQALTPDVFGFYKQGKGYISAGSTQATDFRPGQWVPKTPRVIKSEIIRRGGFGVNGFYLPMNDSKNFGADFHCESNSIIKLNEELPQPRVGVATTASVGLGYTDVLRADPYAANLLVACPFVSGGLGTDGTVSATIPGLGDYHQVLGGQSNAPINIEAGNGTQATVAIGTGVYYGSSLEVTTSSIRPRASVGTALTITGDYTVEFWTYINSFDAVGTHLVQYDTNAGATGWAITHDGGKGRFLLRDSSGTDYQIQTTVGVATVGQWNHWAGVYERNQNRITLYVNGVAVGINTNVRSDYPSAQYSGLNRLNIGSNTGDGSRPMLGYMQDLRIYNTAKYKGGFDVPKPYTPVGIATWRAVPDCTANNFATWNAVQNSMSLTDGNLTCTGTGSNQEVYSTIGITTGKWYVEARTNVGTYNHFGVRANSTATYAADYRLVARDDGTVYGDTSQGQVGTLSSGYASAGSIVAMAIDGNLGQITYYVNGVNVGGPYSIYQYNTSSLPTSYKIYNLVNSGNSLTVNFGQNPSFSGNTTAGTFTDSNSKGLFKYQPPSGFLALCEDNLPTPAIKNPGEYFKTVLYTGDSNASRSITGVGFTPDLIWGKSRTNTAFPFIIDSIRGPGNRLFTNDTQGDNLNITSISSFNSDGFSMGSLATNNASSQNYVAWCWRAGAGTTSTNTNGSITSVVSVNQDAGFSIVSYTGSGANSTVGHGLGRAPAMYITKGRAGAVGATNWNVYHKALGPDKYLQLNSTNEAGTSTTLWQNTNPTSSVFYLSSSSGDTNGSGSTYIAYCWAEIEGYSKFGSYTGNGITDGPFVYTGGRPAFVMIKRTDSTNDWYIHNTSTNPTNPSQLTLLANTFDIEGSLYNHIDILSNGFKCRKSDAGTNASGGTYIFACWMESPFQTANSK